MGRNTTINSNQQVNLTVNSAISLASLTMWDTARSPILYIELMKDKTPNL